LKPGSGFANYRAKKDQEDQEDQEKIKVGFRIFASILV